MDLNDLMELIVLDSAAFEMTLAFMITFFTNEENEELYSVLNMYNIPLNHIRSPNFYEQWIPRYLDYDFFQLFRMTRQTFNLLIANITCPELNKPYEGGGEPLQVDKQLMITLYWLGRGEVLFSVGDRFNVAISTVHKCTERILCKLITLLNKYICWPDAIELINIEAAFRRKANFPGVIGAIDGTCIEFKPPAQHQESYIDKNLNHSIKLQAIVTADKIFTSIMVGFPGSAHDSRVLRNSFIFMEQERNNRKYFPNEEYHIVGDKAYPLKNWLLTPFKDNGRLLRRQRRYNTALSKTRMVVENTFGTLKGRWRILNYINVNHIEKAVKIIAACCILHNFCYINSDEWEEYQEQNYEDEDDNELYNELPNEAAVWKRNNICQLFE